MGEISRDKDPMEQRVMNPSTVAGSRSVTKELEVPKALSDSAKKLLEELMRFYVPQEYPYNYEKMDPDRGGIFKDELFRVTGEDPEEALKELSDAAFVTFRETPIVATATTVWLTGKGKREGEIIRSKEKSEK